MSRVRGSAIALVEADFSLWRSNRGIQQWPELFHDITQDNIMFQELPIHLGEPFENDGIGQKGFAHLHKRTDDLHAHRDGARAAQDGGRHDRAVLGEHERRLATTAATLRGHRSRPRLVGAEV